jgi:hypothetical protein
LSGGEHATGGGLDFDGADAFPPEQLAAEYASTSARE